ERRLAFLNSFATVAGEFSKDKYQHINGNITLQDLIDKYGHLRPGTYDITAQAYWEDPARYLVSDNDVNQHQETNFAFTEQELLNFSEVLTELGAKISPQQLVSYLIKSIQSREFVKFEFTRNLSLALDYCIKFGEGHHIGREELAFLTFIDLKYLKLNLSTLTEINDLIKMRQKAYATTAVIELPSFIQQNIDLFCFERLASQPNFVTSSRVTGKTHCLATQQAQKIKGKIILIPQADPGYDWLFGHGIAGLITQFGGANSHMAIRAAEIGLPAAIGVGEKLYEAILMMSKVEIDCGNQLIRRID
ncbi:MAG: hypothetical protein GY787_00025, partial [Alteromonadales bacterium]|nr:hypothetical protein [Alteromonadales bacterium]